MRFARPIALLVSMGGTAFGAAATTAPASAPVPATAPAVPPAPRPTVAAPKVADGFAATVFASAPDIASPASMAVSPDGKVFVGEDPYNAGAGTEAGLGRVHLCVDTDGDGAADRFTTFAEKLNSPQGMCFVDGTLYVVHAPFLSALRDTDDDGVSDARDDLVTGLGPEPKDLVHHVPSGVRMGVDGWLYVSVGDKGIPEATAKDGSRVRLQGGGVVRVRADGTCLELYSRGQRNTYDVSIDPLLNVYTRDNTNDGRGWNSFVTLVQRDADYGYPHLYKNYGDEVAPHVADYGGGSATGSVYVHDATWPDGFGHALYTCDWVKGTVYRHQLRPDGAGFSLTSDDFLKGANPTDLDLDGLGAFYASDWARQSWGASDARGVVFRVASTQPVADRPAPKAFPDMAVATPDQLLAWLAEPRAVWALHAQRELLRRGPSDEVIAALRSIIDQPKPLHARVAAMFTLLQMQGPAAKDVLLAAAETPALREHALRALADRQEHLPSVGSGPFLAALSDANPRVRVLAAVALGRLDQPDVAARLLQLTADPDARVRHAALRSLRRLNAIDASLAAVRDANTDPAVADGALRVLRGLHDARAVAGLKSLLAESRDPARRVALTKTLARLYRTEGEWDNGWWSPWPDTTGPYVKAVAWEQSSAVADVIADLVSDADAAVARAALEQVGVFPINEAAAAVSQLASMTGELRTDAARTLTKLTTTDDAIRAALAGVALESTFPPDVRGDAVGTLAKVDAAGAAALAQLAETIDAQADVPAPVVERLAAALSDRKLEDATVPALEKLTAAKSVALRGAAAAAILKGDSPVAKEAAARLWQAKEAAAVESVLAALSRLPKEAGQAYLDRVRPLLSDKRLPVRHAAISAAGHLADGASAATLLKLAARGVDRTPAMQALAQIGPEKTPDDQLLPVAHFLVTAAASMADGTDRDGYARALDGAGKFLQDKRLPPDELKALSSKLLMAGVIGTFRVAGPIPSGLSDSFQATFPPEASPAGPYEPFTVGDKRFEWTPLDVTDAQGHQALDQPDGHVTYLAATLDAKRAGPAVLTVRSDDGVVVWLNGEKVHSHSVGRSVTVAQDQIHVTLREGSNELLFRVNNLTGPSGVAARVRYRIGEFDPGDVAGLIKDRPADTSRGRVLFDSLGCVQCHTTDPAHELRGPFLGDAGGKYDRNHLLDSILRPSAATAQGFATQRVVVADEKGKTTELMGFVVNDTPEGLGLRDLTGKVTQVSKRQIKEHATLPQSMMPSSLADGLTPDELAALIAYLESLKPSK